MANSVDPDKLIVTSRLIRIYTVCINIRFGLSEQDEKVNTYLSEFLIEMR